jgi:nicotinate phosphoribosyltransferase
MIQRAFGLTTDLYELTMAAAYFESGIHNRAIFDLFIRRLPNHRSFLITAGLEQALEYLSEFRFTDPQIDFLREHPSFNKVSKEFFDYLSEVRFTGDVWAMPEGTVAFGMEPLLRVEAPIIEAQIAETFLLSTINFQTMIASKASRVVAAAQNRDVIEFGTRRAHGTEAGLFAARAAFIGGCIGTSNVEAGYIFGLPTFGTLAHSFVMAFENEDDAFAAFLRLFPDTGTVLVDTYDTIAAVKRLARDFGSSVPAVRLDSGDLGELSKQVRAILDSSGMSATKIFASSDLNERSISDLLERGAKIDAFGVGTELATSFDSPSMSAVYKLAGLERDGHMLSTIKLSDHKSTYPGAKQVWRHTDDSGEFLGDLISLADEPAPQEGVWQSLLAPVMKNGKAIASRSNSDESDPARSRAARLSDLKSARDRARDQVGKLPAELLKLETTSSYRVEFSDRIHQERKRIEQRLTRVNHVNL